MSTPNARMTLAGRFLSRTTLDTHVSAFDAQTVDLAVPEGYDARTFAWVEFDLPDGSTVRPLVEVKPIPGRGVVTGRIRHLAPEDREALEKAGAPTVS